jgi:ectoine hydroxylase-related dioxygenase (phytanoyl-CoA dioxygenase family)
MLKFKTSTSDKILQELHAPLPLTPAQVAQYHDQGFIKLKQVFSAGLLEYYGSEITRLVLALNKETKPLEQRDTYGKAFLQIQNLWTHSELVKEFVFSQRLGKMAADLMRVKAVRMYHDQALYKEAGGGYTPWHADQYYWPVDTDNTTTVWIPLQDTPLNRGPLAFSAGSQKCQVGRDLVISDESEQRISKELLEKKLPMVETPYDLGELSFHMGWTFHRAAPNTSGVARRVMTIIYIADGARVVPLKNKNQEYDLATWMPGTKPGDLVATPINPVLYPV